MFRHNTNRETCPESWETRPKEKTGRNKTMKHRILAAVLCVCLALTSLYIPALAGDTENGTPAPMEEPVEATPAPAETTPAPVEEMTVEAEEQPLEAADVPSTQAWGDPKIHGVVLEVGTYYKNDPSASCGFSEATADDYNFYFDGTTLFLRNADLKGTGNQPMGSALLTVFIPLVIDLTGENRFSVNANYTPITGGDITIRGDGSLALEGGITAITRLTMESGTVTVDRIQPRSFGASGKGLCYKGGNFTATAFGGDGDGSYGPYYGLNIIAEFYRWKTNLSKDYMPSIFETCPDPNGISLSLVQMDDPFRSKLRVNPATNEWEVSYDGGTTWKSLGVKATGEDGKDGRDGRTPSVGLNGNWWIGSMDTGVKAVGTDGRDGVDGKNGADGLTPAIGENGNWWIGDTDTGVKAGGADGKDGTDGLTPTIGENGNWWIGDTDTGVKAAASDGRDGADGKDGVDGKDGANGKDGVDGKDGTDGAQGAPGLTPSIGGNGNWWLGNTDTGVRAAGTTGATGAAGATGATGATGAAGRNGTDGKDGKDGKDGVGIREVSLNGSGELIVTLTDGTETNLGKITGKDGAPGVGISSVQVGENGMLTVTLSNGESVEAGAVFSAQEGKTVKTVSYITAAAAVLAFLWLAVLTALFAKSRRTAVHR